MNFEDKKRRYRKIFIALALLASISCVRTVYLPKNAAHYREEYLKEEKARIILQEQLDKCVEAGEALRRDCD